MSLWKKLEAEVLCTDLPDGFPRMPSGLALARLEAAEGDELIVTLGGDQHPTAALGGRRSTPANRAEGSGRGLPAVVASSAGSYDLDSICFNSGSEHPVDLWTRRFAPTGPRSCPSLVDPLMSVATAGASSFSRTFGAPFMTCGASTPSNAITAAPRLNTGRGRSTCDSQSTLRCCGSHQDGKGVGAFQRSILAFPPKARRGFSFTPLDSRGRRYLLFGGRAGGGRASWCLGGSGAHARCFADVHVLELGNDLALVKERRCLEVRNEGNESQALGSGEDIQDSLEEAGSDESEEEEIFFADDYRAGATRMRYLEQAKSVSLDTPTLTLGAANQGSLQTKSASALAASIARQAGRAFLEQSPASSAFTSPREDRSLRRSCQLRSASASSESSVDSSGLAVNNDGESAADLEGRAAELAMQRPVSKSCNETSAAWRTAAAGWRLHRPSVPHRTTVGACTSSQTPSHNRFGANTSGRPRRPVSQGTGAARWRLPTSVSCDDAATRSSSHGLLSGITTPSMSATVMPRARAGHTAVLVSHTLSGSAELDRKAARASVIIYGGLDDAGMPLGDAHLVQIVEPDDHSLKAIWSCIDNGGVGLDQTAPWDQRARPRPRACHSAVFQPRRTIGGTASDGVMVVFGGLGLGVDGEARAHGDTWVLAVSSDTSESGQSDSLSKWRRPPLKGGGPACRWGHGCCLVGAATMLICGGIDGSGLALSDCWVLDLQDMRWDRIENSLRTYHSGLSNLSIPVDSREMPIDLTTDSGEVGRCAAIWSATHDVVLIWSTDGLFRWQEPETMRLHRVEQERRLLHETTDEKASLLETQSENSKKQLGKLRSVKTPVRKTRPSIQEELDFQMVSSNTKREIVASGRDLVGRDVLTPHTRDAMVRIGQELRASEFVRLKGTPQIRSEPRLPHAPPWLPSLPRPTDRQPADFQEVIAAASVAFPPTPPLWRHFRCTAD